jgi:hypothetical protein
MSGRRDWTSVERRARQRNKKAAQVARRGFVD